MWNEYLSIVQPTTTLTHSMIYPHTQHTGIEQEQEQEQERDGERRVKSKHLNYNIGIKNNGHYIFVWKIIPSV